MRRAGRSSCITGAVAESVVRLISRSTGACAERIVGSGIGGPFGVLTGILVRVLVRFRAGPAGIRRRGRQLSGVTALGVRAARLGLPRVLLRQARLRCRVAFAGGGVAAEPGASGGPEPTTCCLGIGVAPMRSALVRGKLWQVVYSSKTVCSCNTARSPFSSPAQGTPRPSDFRPVFLRGSETRPQSTSRRFYACTLMNAGIPVWGSGTKGTFGPDSRPSRVGSTMTKPTLRGCALPWMAPFP
ncbi:hypothetical protein BI49514_00456 [Brevibacterium iodinum ATCC 49514]|uniref:Uncharacterized protein n=1 Tax=Brevibacterium iodinum ATCC 49514 TaxID=1255616 RepID=A0A2H1HX10_9MICO|nr:hypothetical protein BI49514_00456 [Brevibacterium iodinum ATCC 49514]SUW13738.1 Uncharacterised protein [Brevibacterium iodinum]